MRLGGLFEPPHGSAFDIMGKEIAVPVATSGTASMMLEHPGEAEAAQPMMEAVEWLVADPSLHTPDLGGRAATRRATDALIAAVRGRND